MSVIARPTRDRIIVREAEEAESETTSGIVLPASVQKAEGVRHVEVVAVGPGTPFETRDGIETLPVCVKEGDKILIAMYGGMDILLEGDKYILLHESDILATM